MSDAVKCPVCNGSGRVAVDSAGRLDTSEGAERTITCHGCGGKGWVEVSERR